MYMYDSDISGDSLLDPNNILVKLLDCTVPHCPSFFPWITCNAFLSHFPRLLTLIMLYISYFYLVKTFSKSSDFGG